MVPTEGYEILFRRSWSIRDSKGLPRYTQGYTTIRSEITPFIVFTPLIPQIIRRALLPSLDSDNKDGPEKIANMVSSGHHYPARPGNMNHSVGGILNLEDRDGGRKANSVSWAGVAKSEWWIDPTTGLAGICASQLISQPPDPWFDVYSEYQKLLYAGLA